MSMYNCEHCGASEFLDSAIEKSYSFNDEQLKIAFNSMICSKCGKDGYTTPEQTRVLNREIVIAKKKSLGFLSGEEMRQIRKDLLDISQVEFELMFEFGKNTIYRWEKDISLHKGYIEILYRSVLREFSFDILVDIFPKSLKEKFHRECTQSELSIGGEYESNQMKFSCSQFQIKRSGYDKAEAA